MENTLTAGYCHFCEQMHNVIPPYDTPDEQATLQCNCDKAKDYQSYIKAVKKTEEMFDDEELVAYVKYQAERVYKHVITSVNINVDSAVNVKVSRTTKNKLRIKLENKTTQIVEA